MDLEFFKANGYLLSGIRLSDDLLTEFQNISRDLELKALSAHSNGHQLHGACVIEDPVGSRLMRYDDLFLNHFDELNRLLATPELLRLVKSLCGPRAVFLQADILYKHQHPHPVVKWHQGAPSSHDSHYLNIGIYLDNADLNDGCLRYVPGTHHDLQDIGQIEREFGWNPPGVVQAPAKSGDIMLQEMMILHSSEPKRSAGTRRTIYVEARPYEAVQADNRQDFRWLELRRFWMAEILKKDTEQVFTESEKTFFNKEYDMSTEQLIREISSHICPPIPAVYNFQDDEGPDYPIPLDLK